MNNEHEKSFLSIIKLHHGSSATHILRLSSVLVKYILLYLYLEALLRMLQAIILRPDQNLETFSLQVQGCFDLF